MQVKVWHVKTTREAARILGVKDVTHEQYQAFEDLVWPLYEAEHTEVVESTSADYLRKAKQKEQTDD